ncbi:MAG: mitochondrial fission ELM1 family protein [Deltaproteobacteria bacterium]|nr:mitochondrial fission ELM1 family protein [Deltaproteobacteria bacterium]
MHIVCFLDGRPGHEKQTYGIVRALEKKVNLRLTEIKVSRRPVWQSFFGLIRLNLPWPADFHYNEITTKPDLVLGTGSSTHLAILGCKKQYKIPAVTCMTPDFFFRSRFDLCFVPAHDGLKQKQKNIFTTVGPPNCSKNKMKHRTDCGLILVGGIDEKSHRWDSAELAKKIEKIVKKETAMQWVISTSPRTPDPMASELEKLSRSCPNVSFFDFRKTEFGWLEQQYDNCASVWVTADSVSMVFEALTAGCSVGMIPVDWKKRDNKFKRSLSDLENKGFILPYGAWLEENYAWPEHENLNEAQRCADAILERWWPTKNLQ